MCPPVCTYTWSYVCVQCIVCVSRSDQLQRAGSGTEPPRTHRLSSTHSSLVVAVTQELEVAHCSLELGTGQDLTMLSAAVLISPTVSRALGPFSSPFQNSLTSHAHTGKEGPSLPLLHLSSSSLPPSHLPVCTPSHLSPSHLPVCTPYSLLPSHLSTFLPSHLPIFTLFHPHTFTPFCLHTITLFCLHTITPSHFLAFTISHLHTFLPSHPHTSFFHNFTPSCLSILTPSYLPAFTPSHLLILTPSQAPGFQLKWKPLVQAEASDWASTALPAPPRTDPSNPQI